MQVRFKWTSLLLILALLASLLGACGVTPASPQPEQEDLVLLQDTPAPAPGAAQEEQETPNQGAAEETPLPEDGSYTTKEDVCAYLIAYGHLPANFITKNEVFIYFWHKSTICHFF